MLLTVTGTGASQTVSVTDTDGNAYDAETYTLDNDPASGMIACLTVKNRPVTLQVIKEDGVTHEPLSGVKFDLYRQVTGSDGNPIKDYTPWISGGVSWSGLTTDASGILSRISADLPDGTWYLTETVTVDGYALLTEDVIFTVGADGHVSVTGAEQSGWLERTVDLSGALSYVVRIPNTEIKKLQFVKADFNDPSGSRLRGAKFDLYATHTEDEGGTTVTIRDDVPLRTGIVSRSDGTLSDGDTRIFELPLGVYYLVETEAPAGYLLRETPIIVTLGPGSGAVSYDEGTPVSAGGTGISFAGGVYTLTLTNSPGVELPATGGTGTLAYTVIGLSLMLLSGCVLAAAEIITRKHGRG